MRESVPPGKYDENPLPQLAVFVSCGGLSAKSAVTKKGDRSFSAVDATSDLRIRLCYLI
jgi:hypothetical protein